MIPNRETLKSWIATHETPVLVQFIKYGICGGLAVIVYMVVTLLLVLSYPERVAETLPDATRALNLNIFQAIAFVPANVFGYLVNRRFVFTPGRHKVAHEFAWFMAVALVSTGVGLLATDLVIRYLSAPNWTGTAASVGASALMNFVCRKFLVFAR